MEIFSKTKTRLKHLPFILPLGIFLVLTTLFPTLYVVFASFFRNYLPDRQISFVFLENYVNILKDPEFWKSLYNTFIYVSSTVFLHITFALFLAFFLTKSGRFAKLAAFFRSIFMLPWLLSWTVAASIWLLILYPAGVLSSILIKMGFLSSQVDWLGDPSSAMKWIILISFWKASPFFMMFIYAALTTVPSEILEAAEIDGASYWNKLRFILIPYIAPTLFTLVILDIIWSIRQFDIIFLTTAGGPLKSTQTLTLYIYFTAFESLKFGLASAQGVITLAVSSIFALIYILFGSKLEV